MRIPYAFVNNYEDCKDHEETILIHRPTRYHSFMLCQKHLLIDIGKKSNRFDKLLFCPKLDSIKHHFYACCTFRGYLVFASVRKDLTSQDKFRGRFVLCLSEDPRP